MKASELTPGTKVTFTPTGVQFTIAKVTDKNISWYTRFTFKGGNGVNNLKMAWCSVKQFQKGLDSGAYVINH